MNNQRVKEEIKKEIKKSQDKEKWEGNKSKLMGFGKSSAKREIYSLGCVYQNILSKNNLSFCLRKLEKEKIFLLENPKQEAKK